MRARPHGTQTGFTLLELIVVICLLSIVLSQILPQVAANLKLAHETAVKLEARALHDGVERAKAMQMLDGLSGATYNLPRFGDGTLDLSPAGFPAGTTRRPGDHLNARHCMEIWHAVLEPNPENKRGEITTNYRASVVELDSKTGKRPICVYSYLHGGRMSISYDPATGEVWADAKFKGSALAD